MWRRSKWQSQNKSIGDLADACFMSLLCFAKRRLKSCSKLMQDCSWNQTLPKNVQCRRPCFRPSSEIREQPKWRCYSLAWMICNLALRGSKMQHAGVLWLTFKLKQVLRSARPVNLHLQITGIAGPVWPKGDICTTFVWCFIFHPYELKSTKLQTAKPISSSSKVKRGLSIPDNSLSIWNYSLKLPAGHSSQLLVLTSAPSIGSFV